MQPANATSHQGLQAHTPADPARPHLDERPDYSPRFYPEEFIVRNLLAAIEGTIASLPAPGSGAKVLDVGCGRQPFRSLLTRKGYVYCSMDTQQNADCPVDHVAPIDGELPAGLIADAPFDLLFCTEVMEHVCDWQAAFANFVRLTRPGSRVFITCPHFYVLHEEPYDFWRATPHSLATFARRHSFEVEKFDKIGSGLDVLGTVMASSAYRPASPVGRLLAPPCNLLRKALFVTLRTRVLHRHLRDAGTLYQSNLALLRRM